MPFQKLSDNEFALEDHERFSQSDMDRLSQLKFNPFQSNNDIAQSRNNANLDISFDISKINCNYYLSSEFKEQTTKINQTNYFTMLHLNIRSISNKFDSFKHLLNSLNKTAFQIIGLTETWLNDRNYENIKLEEHDYIGSNRINKKVEE